nr:uncharacterized protein LOC113825322 [Penaeus vannamei]
MEFGCERKHSYENKTRKLKKEFEFPAESKEVLKSKICQNPSVDESTTASVRGDVANIQDHELMRLAETLESTVVEKALMMIQFLNNRNKQLCNQNLIRLKPSNWARKSCPSFEGEASSRTLLPRCPPRIRRCHQRGPEEVGQRRQRSDTQ